MCSFVIGPLCHPGLQVDNASGFRQPFRGPFVRFGTVGRPGFWASIAHFGPFVQDRFFAPREPVPADRVSRSHAGLGTEPLLRNSEEPSRTARCPASSLWFPLGILLVSPAAAETVAWSRNRSPQRRQPPACHPDHVQPVSASRARRTGGVRSSLEHSSSSIRVSRRSLTAAALSEGGEGTSRSPPPST